MGGFTPSYDANRNLTNDGVQTYAWDSNSNSITVGGVGLTFDALDRMVEQNRSGSYTQIVYGPNGGKLGLMSGQTLKKGFVPLSAGTTTYTYDGGGVDGGDGGGGGGSGGGGASGGSGGGGGMKCDWGCLGGCSAECVLWTWATCFSRCGYLPPPASYWCYAACGVGLAACEGFCFGACCHYSGPTPK